MLDVDDLDTPIYRWFSNDRFLELLRTGQLTLVRPRMWEDPFENFLMGAAVRLSSGEPVSLADLQSRFYGQCWTFNRESDALWRIYSPLKTGVKVATTARKLFDAIWSDEPRDADLSCFLGLVRYLPEAQFAAILRDQNVARSLLLDGTGLGHVRMLLLKREEFSHEAEVRLLFRDVRRERAPGPNVVQFEIDPSRLFDEVVLDPRADAATVGRLQDEIGTLGYAGAVRQSPLYRLPDFEITIERPGRRRPGVRTWYTITDGELRMRTDVPRARTRR